MELFESLSNVTTISQDHIQIPHIIICHLKRIKIDANRGIDDATARQNIGDEAWYEYHNFIEIAKRKSLENFGFAHYFDVHGNTVSTKTMMGMWVGRYCI